MPPKKSKDDAGDLPRRPEFAQLPMFTPIAAAQVFRAESSEQIP